MDEILSSQVRHLYEVEGLSRRQIGRKLGICRDRVSRIITGDRMVGHPAATLMTQYERIINEWYKEYPFLRATQIYEKLREHGYGGSYTTVSIYTQRYRRVFPIIIGIKFSNGIPILCCIINGLVQPVIS